MHYDIHQNNAKISRTFDPKISFFMQNTAKMVLFFRAKVLFLNENQAEKGLKSLIFDHQNSVKTLVGRSFQKKA